MTRKLIWCWLLSEPQVGKHSLHQRANAEQPADTEQQACAEQRADAEQQAELQPAHWQSVQSHTDAITGIPSDKAMPQAHANPAESAHEPAESASANFEAGHAESASTQLPAEARHVAAQLAVSVLVPHHDEDLHSPSASSTHTQGSRLGYHYLRVSDIKYFCHYHCDIITLSSNICCAAQSASCQRDSML